MLKTHWTNPPVPTPGGSGGAGVTAASGDPLITEGAKETGNMSELGPLPSRFEPSGTPPAPPSLQDRNPGTIDQR